MSCLTLHLLGSGASLHPHRSQPAVALEYGGYVVLIDAGCAAPQRLEALGLPPIPDAILLTHKHYDHLCGLPMMAFIASFRGGILTVYGEEEAIGLASELVGLASISSSSRVEASFTPVKPGGSIVVGPFRIEAFEAKHSVPALSYQLEAGDLRILVSGDTRPTTSFRERAKQAHAALHEATLPSTLTDKAVKTGHSTVEEAIAQVSSAEVGILYHLTVESEREALRAPQGARGSRVVVAPEPVTIKIC
ncbi:MAG: MBL fold metallo-hydrolase [Desulfurococcales archaeon]|nr:MBL fold metallo-hydrolase [Desulfurococcales archaeon]